jgi:putative lipoprotein
MLRRRAQVLLALTLLGSTAAAQAQEADPWFGPDKLLHFEAAGSLAVVGYAGASFATEDRRLRAATGATIALGAGVAKEIWDLEGHGDASFRDLAWDVVGAATGVLLASAIDWLVHRSSSHPVAADRTPDR